MCAPASPPPPQHHGVTDECRSQDGCQLPTALPFCWSPHGKTTSPEPDSTAIVAATLQGMVLAAVASMQGGFAMPAQIHLLLNLCKPGLVQAQHPCLTTVFLDLGHASASGGGAGDKGRVGTRNCFNKPGQHTFFWTIIVHFTWNLGLQVHHFLPDRNTTGCNRNVMECERVLHGCGCCQTCVCMKRDCIEQFESCAEDET